ncbi:MAG: endonuclease [Oscillospiraceae bacterium]|nr:endonuclease [Oscillospiraceae bacterium]
MKKLLKILGFFLLAIVIFVGAILLYLTVREYRPAEQESIAVESGEYAATFSGNTVSILTFNTGYAELGDNADFFMDGGKSVQSTDETRMNENLSEIAALRQKADFTLLQEVDQNSKRSYHVDQTAYYEEAGFSGAFALNFSCPYVPYPLPTIGQVNSGVLTLSGFTLGDAERISLPCPFSWPVSIANLKRCLLITRVPIQGSDKELVLVNLHLEAYDDGAGKAAQTEKLLSVLQEEYKKGNYVIAGGDFNQTFPGGLDAYPIKDASLWTPGVLEESSLPDGWQFACDSSNPTCRLLNQPYDASSEQTQYYVIDGFILSPNVEKISVETLNLEFHASDHNPVYLEATLK